MWFLFVASLWAQECEVPKSVSLVAAEDYAPHQPQVAVCIRHLLATHPADDPDRRETQEYVMAWLTGTPTVIVNLNIEFTGPIATAGAPAEILRAYMLGAALYAMESTPAGLVDTQVAGIRSMLAVYALLQERDPSLRVAPLEKYRRWDAAGKLASKVAKKMSLEGGRM